MPKPPVRQIAALVPTLLLLASAALVSCDKAEPATLPTTEQVVPPGEIRYPGVDAELQEYFARYELEASLRGIEVDLGASDVRGFLVEIDDEGVAGTCTFNPAEPNTLRVDLETWEAVSASFREYIVFHELGHCERLRAHREAEDPSGRCESIMASGTEGCTPAYRPDTREAYLDELFDGQYYGTWQPE